MYFYYFIITTIPTIMKNSFTDMYIVPELLCNLVILHFCLAVHVVQCIAAPFSDSYF